MQNTRRSNSLIGALFLIAIILAGIVLISHGYHRWVRNNAAVRMQGDPECQEAAARADRSNGERFTAVSVTTDITGYYQHYCIIDWENDQGFYLDGRLQRDWFLGWTIGQHYGIFTTASHYGVTETIVFDTEQWRIAPEAGTECAMPYAMTACYGGVVAISPIADQYLNRWGQIVDIPTGTRTQLSSPIDWSVYGGTWSPDGTHLAYLTREKSEITANSILFLARGDGSQAQEIAALPLAFRWSSTRWHWLSGGQQLVLTTGEDENLRYVLDITTGRLHQDVDWHESEGTRADH